MLASRRATRVCLLHLYLIDGLRTCDFSDICSAISYIKCSTVFVVVELNRVTTIHSVSNSQHLIPQVYGYGFDSVTILRTSMYIVYLVDIFPICLQFVVRMSTQVMYSGS